MQSLSPLRTLLLSSGITLATGAHAVDERVFKAAYSASW